MIRLRYAAFTAVLMLGVSQALAQSATSPAASPDASGGGQTVCPANQPNCQPGTKGKSKGTMGTQGSSSSSGTKLNSQTGTSSQTTGSTNSGTSGNKKLKLNGTASGGTSSGTSGTSGTASGGATGTTSGGSSGGTSGGASGTASGGTSGSTSGTVSGSASGGSSSSTTNINITSTQQTKVKQIIMQASPPKVTENIQVSVGEAVPQTVSSDLEACPADLIQIAPGLAVIRSDCKYFVLPDGEIVFVDANTMKVVYVIS